MKQLLFWPVCRSYAKHIMKDRPADRLFRFLCSPQFWTVYRFWPDFAHPKRFSERLWSRMLHDRDPFLTLITDKVAVRDYVSERVGEEFLIPVLWVGDRPEKIPFEDLPERFVIKTNHGAGYVVVVMDKKEIDWEHTKSVLSSWLDENYCEEYYLGIEWGYRNIQRKIIIEKSLASETELPVDYKFFCFAGRVEFVFVHFDRLHGQKNRVFDRGFQNSMFDIDLPQGNRSIERPENYDSLLEVAESLASDFEFIRVDLYSSNGEVFFGELTPYPGGVGVKIMPEIEDRSFGEKWKLK